MAEESLVEQVRAKYAAAARSPLSGAQAGVRQVAEAFGYTPEDLAALPAEAHLGLSCGNPIATAQLQPGEVVVDLGSGGGLDVLLASQKVGPTGRVIGVDMTPEMIARAESAARRFGGGERPANIEFRLGRIEQLPLEDNSVDCLISNCVLNLVPDKAIAFRELFRVLKPGGRLAASDIALKHALPEDLARSVAAYVGCIAGALPIADYVRLLQEAGFTDVRVVDSAKDLNVYTKLENQSACCCGGAPDTDSPAAAEVLKDLADLASRHDLNAYAASAHVRARKPWEADMRSANADAVRTVEVFDRPLCCSTGICGPRVDPVLVHFAADLEWLKSQGVLVHRFNPAFEPAAFTRHEDVRAALHEGRGDCLPLIRVDGRIVSRARYPERSELAAWCGLAGSVDSPTAAPNAC